MGLDRKNAEARNVVETGIEERSALPAEHRGVRRFAERHCGSENTRNARPGTGPVPVSPEGTGRCDTRQQSPPNEEKWSERHCLLGRGIDFGSYDLAGPWRSAQVDSPSSCKLVR